MNTWFGEEKLLGKGRMKPDGGRREWLGGQAASLAFYGYALLVAPWLAEALKEGLARAEPMWIPGFIVVAGLLLEAPAVRWKVLFLRRRNREESFEPQGPVLGLASVTVIGHMIVSAIVGMVALDGWGLAGEGTDGTWAGAAMVLLVFKDLTVFFWTGGEAVSREPPGHWKERVADGLLVAFGCVAYTVWWGALLDLGELASESWAMKVALAPLLGGVFALFYLPMRLPFVLEECYRRPAQGRKGRVLAELAAGALLGFYPAFF